MAKTIGEMTPDEAKAAGFGTPTGNSAPTPSAKQLDPSAIDKMADGAGKIAAAGIKTDIAFEKLTKGTDAATAAVDIMAKGVSMIGLPGLANMSQKLATAFLEQKANMDTASRELGIGANNIGAFVRMSGEAGLTTQQFTDTIKKTDGLMSGLAGSAQRGAEVFSKVQKTLIESNAGEALAAIGVSGKELADMTALSMSNNTKLNLKTAAGQAEAAEAAGKLAFELDATSKITGQSREALAATLKAEESKPNVILMEMQMTKEQLAGYKNLKEQMVGFGPSFQSLSAEIASGGVRTKEGLAQMAALGPAGVEFEKATRAMTNAKTKEEKENAQAQLDRAQAAINQRMASKEYNDMMQYGTAEQKAAIASQVSGYKGLQGAQKAAQEADGDYAKGRKNQLAEATAMQAGQKVDKDGKPIVDEKGNAVADEGAKTAQMLNAANRQATIQAGGMSRAMETVNDKLGKSATIINGFNSAMGALGGAKTMKESENQWYKLPSDTANAAGLGGKATEKPESGTTGRKVDKPHAEFGAVVEPKAGGTDVNVAEGGKTEAILPLDRLKDMLGNVATTVSSAAGKESKSSGSAGISMEEINKVKAEIATGGVRTIEGMKIMSALGPKGAELQKQFDSSQSKISKTSEGIEKSANSMLNDMFNPKIIDQKAADAQKAETAKGAPKTTDAAPKKEEEQKKEAEAKAKADAEAKAKETKPATAQSAGGGDATLKDLKDQLVLLNKHMTQLISHSENTADAASKTAKNSAKTTGSRF